MNLKKYERRNFTRLGSLVLGAIFYLGIGIARASKKSSGSFQAEDLPDPDCCINAGARYLDRAMYGKEIDNLEDEPKKGDQE